MKEIKEKFVIIITCVYIRIQAYVCKYNQSKASGNRLVEKVLKNFSD